jgi:thiamine kinase-like enzyme
MNQTDYVKWADLFQKEIKNPRRVEILQEIDVGYNSKVYQILIDGRQYAVKIYNERFNGTKVCQIERNNIKKARQAIPDAVPKVLFCSKHVENEFQREILVMENERGVHLNKNVFNEQAFEELINVLKRLHKTRIFNRKVINERKRIDTCRETIIQFLKEDEIIPLERVSKHIDMLSAYCDEKKIFDFPKTVIHGDLWWDNILVDNGKIIIVDWLESSEQDYCQDLAQLRIGTLKEIFDTSKSEYFFKKIVNSYQKEFEDETIFDRIRYYVPLLYLEEAFFLPFKFFPWEIKYKENAEDFKKRFIDYFEKSECYFRHRM